MGAEKHVPLVAIIELGRCYGPNHREVAIGALPDTALLDMFAFYVDESDYLEGWHVLVHVCQRWRYLVFAPPHRLDLRLLRRGTTPVREILDF